MKDRRLIKREILAQFRAGIQDDRDALSVYWFAGHYLSGLSRSERQLLAQAIFELVKIGLVRWSDGMVARDLKLTSKGRALLC